MDRDEHQKWFQDVVNHFKGLSPEVREIELNHLEMALRDVPAKKKPGPKKGFKRGKVKGTKLTGLKVPVGAPDEV
jgi:hypothetical protein